MRAEIDDIIAMGKEPTQLEESHEASDDVQRRKYDEMQRKLNMQFKPGPADAPVTGFAMQDDATIQRSSQGMN